MGVNEIDFRGLNASHALDNGLQIGARLGGMYRNNRLQDQELERQEQQRIVDDAARDALNIKAAPTMEAKREALLRRIQAGEAAGRDMSDSRKLLTLGDAEFDLEIDRVIQKALPVSTLAGYGNKANKQFGGQVLLKDENENLFYGTNVNDPDTGGISSALVAVDGSNVRPVGSLSRVNSLGLTASENVGQKGAESGASAAAADFAKFKQETIKQGLTARGLLKTANRLSELNNLIRTGKTAKAVKYMGDLFGVTDPDLGQFNSLAGKLVLGQIRQLGANPTEGERAFLMEIGPSIENGGAVNDAIIQDIADLAQGQIDRATWFSKRENRGKTLEDYFFETGVDDFSLSSSYQGGSNIGRFKIEVAD